MLSRHVLRRITHGKISSKRGLRRTTLKKIDCGVGDGRGWHNLTAIVSGILQDLAFGKDCCAVNQ